VTASPGGCGGSANVSNIMAKVGVSSRGEAAAAAHRMHLFDAVPPP